MPEHALAKTFAGLVWSTMIENTSESSIMPLLMCCQLAPPSAVFHARCHVPAYTTLGSFGSIAIDSMFLISAWPAGDMRSQSLPPSLVRNTPSSAPATRVFGLEADMAIARMDLPCIADNVCQVLPPSFVRKISPICWLCALHADAYMMLEFCGFTTM